MVWCSAWQAPLPVLIGLPGTKQALWCVIGKANTASAQLQRRPRTNKHHAASWDRLLCTGDRHNAGKNGRKELVFTAGWGYPLSQGQDEIFLHLFQDCDPKAMLLLQREDIICLFFPLLTPLIPTAAFPCTISPCSVKKLIWTLPSHFKLVVLNGMLWDPPSFSLPPPLETQNYHQNKMMVLAQHVKCPGFPGRDNRSGRAYRDANTKASPAAGTAAFSLPPPSIMKPPDGKAKIIQTQNDLGWKGPSKTILSNSPAMGSYIFH